MARSPVRAFIFIFLLGFSIRVFFLTKVPEGHILPHDRWEDTAIATSLVGRSQFADPYLIPTGPTAHLPPLVPGILALIWSLFGVGLVGGYAVWIFSITVYSALYALLPWFGGQFGLGRQAGLLGGIGGSLIVLGPGNGEELTGIILGLLAIAFLRRWTSGLGSFGGSVLLGAACGAAFHLQPVLLPVVLGWLVFELWWSRDRRKWRLSAAMVLGMVIACAPWGWRNYTVFDEVFFIRSNLGLELRMGNHEGAAGAMDVMGDRQEYRHPRTHLEEARMVLELGEAEYMRRAKVEAVDWMRAHPGEFLRLTASRLTQFWLGPMHRPGTALAVTGLTILALLGAWRSLPAMTHPQRAALITPLIFYPLIYYVVGYMPRYRVPLDWILLLLAGAAVWCWLEGRQQLNCVGAADDQPVGSERSGQRGRPQRTARHV
jgi:hypothetical protein